ncbi:MAG: hypothetical protein K0R51_1092 [Cytophagaceae bacterium]|jgi:hypothetical protein|nr:hypothetical protein [Cytophagaceae bacterium]
MSTENSNEQNKPFGKTDLPNSPLLKADALDSIEEGTALCYWAGHSYYPGTVACLDNISNVCRNGNWVYLGPCK